jgi:hypothetical protein
MGAPQYLVEVVGRDAGEVEGGGRGHEEAERGEGDGRRGRRRDRHGGTGARRRSPTGEEEE